MRLEAEFTACFFPVLLICTLTHVCLSKKNNKKNCAGGREVCGAEPAARTDESACGVYRPRQHAVVSVTAALCRFLRTMWARRPSTRLLVQAVWNASVLSWFRERKLSKSCDQTSFHHFSSELSNIFDAPFQGVTTKLKRRYSFFRVHIH